jgi:hypothetical protein
MKEAVGEPFLLQNLIVPVALVDPPTLTATLSAMVVDTPATAGELTAPAINTRLADTGALVAGQYNVLLILSSTENNNRAYRWRRRNAADAADIWSQQLELVAGMDTFDIGPLRLVINANERLVVENTVAIAAGQIVQASIWTQGPL